MHFEHTRLLYFSPTSTTKTILEQIAKGIGRDVSSIIDITKPEVRQIRAPELTNDLVLIGAPVYGGRLPKVAADYFSTIKASGCPAIIVVLYGNREFEDALLELKNIAVKSGFVPLAAAAFIGEHSFSNDEFAIAVNRPDTEDLENAFSFGRQINVLLDQASALSDMVPIDVPGNFPYKQGTAFGTFPFIDVSDACDGCGICIFACPQNAIDPDNNWATLGEHCIYCCACIKACPVHARIMNDSPIKEKARWLSENCASRKHSQTFLPG